jgi:hypothetical protein
MDKQFVKMEIVGGNPQEIDIEDFPERNFCFISSKNHHNGRLAFKVNKSYLLLLTDEGTPSGDNFATSPDLTLKGTKVIPVPSGTRIVLKFS